MLKAVEPKLWGKDVAENEYVLRALDLSTINKYARNCHDLAWSLQVTAQMLKANLHCVIATKRDDPGEAWLAKCLCGLM